MFVESNILVDLWFLWIVTDYSGTIKRILIPEKKPRKSKKNPNPDFIEEQKDSNKTISSFRIKVKNAIGLAKRFGINTQIFRNKKVQFCDEVMEVACSIANLFILF